MSMSTEQTNLLKNAKNVKGEQRFFTKFIQEEIIDRGHMEYLKDKEFIEELSKIDERFAISINFLTKKDENKLRSYFEDDKKNLIITEEELEKIPEDRIQRYNYAKKLEEAGNIDIAKRIYKSIIDLGPDSVSKFVDRFKDQKSVDNKDIRNSTYYQSKYSYYMCKVKIKEKLTDKDKEEISKMLKKEKNQIKKLLNGGADIEFIMSILGEEIDIEKLEKEILPNIKEKKSGMNNRVGEGGEDKHLVDFSAQEILDIFKSLGDIRKVTLGKEGMDGFVLFTYDNLTIAEKFFERDDFGDMIEAEKRASTFLVHKKAKLDLEEATKGQLVAAKNAEADKELCKKLISCNYHTPNYEINVKKNYKAMEEIEFDKDTEEIILKERKIRRPKKKKEGQATKSESKKKRTSKKVDAAKKKEKPVDNGKTSEQETEVKEKIFSGDAEEVINEENAAAIEETSEEIDATEQNNRENYGEPNIEDKSDSTEFSEQEPIGTEYVDNASLDEEKYSDFTNRLMELTEEIGRTDENTENLNKELEDLKAIRDGLEQDIANAKNIISKTIEQNSLSKKEMRDSIEKQIKTLDAIQEKAENIEQLQKECESKIEKNETKRKELKKEVDTLLYGSNANGR